MEDVRLEPMDLRDLVRWTIRVLRSRAWVLLGIVATILGLPLFIVDAAFELFTLSFPEGVDASLVWVGLAALAWIIVVLLCPIAQAAVVRAVSATILGRPTGVRDALAAVRPRIWRILGASFLFVLLLFIVIFPTWVIVYLSHYWLDPVTDGTYVALIGTGMALILMAYFFIRFLFVPQVILVENLGTVAAIKRSFRLTDGHVLRILVRLIPLVLILGIVSMLAVWLISGALSMFGNPVPSLFMPVDEIVPGPPASVIVVAGIPGAAIDVVTHLVFFVVLTFMYFDVRARKEGLDSDRLIAQPGLEDLDRKPARKTKADDLAPMDLGDIIGATIGLLRRSPWLYIGITALLLGLPFLVLNIAFNYVAAKFEQYMTMLMEGDSTDFWQMARSADTLVYAAFVLAGWLLSQLLLPLAQAGVVHAVGARLVGRRTAVLRSIAAAWKRGWGAVGSYLLLVVMLLVVFCTSLAIFLGALSVSNPLFSVPVLFVVPFLNLALIVFLLVRFALIVPSALLEGKGTMGALRRSFALTAGYSWRVLGVLSPVVMLLTLVSIILNGLFGRLVALPFEATAEVINPPLFAGQGLIASLVDILTHAVFFIVVLLLYVDLRVRKEGFNLARLAEELGFERPESPAQPEPAMSG